MLITDKGTFGIRWQEFLRFLYNKW